MGNYLLSGITDQIINAFFNVYNELEFGFLEKVYENALRIELEARGFTVRTQCPIPVYYRGVAVGKYFSDLIVDEQIILEIKSSAGITSAHTAQLVNYLKATGIEVGLVLNFGPKPTVARRVFSKQEENQRKS